MWPIVSLTTITILVDVYMLSVSIDGIYAENVDASLISLIVRILLFLQLRVAHAFKNILENSSELPSSQGSLSDLNFGSLAYGFPKHLQSFSTHNCYYPQLHPFEQPEKSQMPNLKSKSADDVLFDPWNATPPPGSFSHQLYVPRSSSIQHNPSKVLSR